jgi:hypothetical protein
MARPKVTIGVVYREYDPQTVLSLLFHTHHDLRVGGRHLDHDAPFLLCATTNIASGRNTICKSFLDSDSDWLLFIDSDQVFEPTLIERLLDSADVDERPVISGLIMARRESHMPISPACALWDPAPDSNRLIRPPTIPHIRWWKVATVGAGCLLIHRRVLEAIRDRYGKTHASSVWFDYEPFHYVDQDGVEKNDVMGEDYVFSMRATECGFDMLVDTTIELGHNKTFTLTRANYYVQQPNICDTFVAIPVKDKLDLTSALVDQLRAQGGWDGLFIIDNGSGKQTKQWLSQQRDMLVFDGKGKGIHEMWNLAANECLRRSAGQFNLILLNNDLILGDRFCEGLVTALRSNNMVAVGPNYDDRPSNGVEQVRGICAERYDGTGGLPGFAMAIRGELFAQGYRFPEDCKWWYGDNDLTMTMDMSALAYGIATDTHVKHLGAGTAGDWQSKKWQPQLAADREAFIRTWKERGVVVGS